MFEYAFGKDHPYKRDAYAIKKYASVMQQYLHNDGTAMVLKSDVQPALQRLVDFTGRNKMIREVSIRLQAANFVRLFSDLKSIRRDSTTRTRLPGYVKILLDLLRDPSDLLIVIVKRIIASCYHRFS